MAACLETQDQLGAKAFLLPGLVPKSASRDVHNQALELLETSQDLLPRGLPCFAFIGGHTSSMDLARNLVEDLLSWVTGVYGVYTPPSPSLAVEDHRLPQPPSPSSKGLHFIAGRLAGFCFQRWRARSGRRPR